MEVACAERLISLGRDPAGCPPIHFCVLRRTEGRDAKHLLRYGYSLWYAYFASLEAVPRRLCGAEMESISDVGPTGSPRGIPLLAHQHGSRLFSSDV